MKYCSIEYLFDNALYNDYIYIYRLFTVGVYVAGGLRMAHS